jgi:hypothetical protein
MAGTLSELVSAVQVISSLTPSNCTIADRHVYFVVANHEAVGRVLQTSLELRFEHYTQRFSTFSALVRSTYPGVVLGIRRTEWGLERV